MNDYQNYQSREEKINQIFKKIPTLTTQRLILRSCQKKDASDMYIYSCRGDLTQYLLWNPHANIDVTKSLLNLTKQEYKRGKGYVWSIILVEILPCGEMREKKMIGTVCFSEIDIQNNKAEIGYVLNPDYQGFGYAREAVLRVLQFAFETCGFARIEARIMSENARSIKLAKALGMRYEGTHFSMLEVKNIRRDIDFYSLLKNDYYKIYKGL